MMRSLGRFCGLLGAVALLFGAAGSFVSGKWNLPLLLGHFAVGMALLLICILTFRTGIRRSKLPSFRSMRSSGNVTLALSLIALLALLLAVNWSAYRFNYRWDLSNDGRASLSAQTQSVLSALPGTVSLVGFTGSSFVEEKVLRRMLELFRYFGGKKVSVTYADVRSQPHLTERYEMSSAEVLFIGYSDAKRESSRRLREISESAIREALVRMSSRELKKVYFLSGHGEPALSGSEAKEFGKLRKELAELNIGAEELLLASAEAIPDDASAVIVAAPKLALMDREFTLLKDYAEAGGSLLLMAEPNGGQDVRRLALEFGIEIASDVVIDELKTTASGSMLAARPFASTYAVHPATRGLDARSLTTFQLASSVKGMRQALAGEVYKELVMSSADAWAEKNTKILFDAHKPRAVFDRDDTPGPVALAVSYEKELSGAVPTRVIAVGDSDWLRNENFEYFSNRMLFRSLVTWLVGDEVPATETRSAVQASAANPLSRETVMFLLACTLLIPELILVCGLTLCWVRRMAAA